MKTKISTRIVLADDHALVLAGLSALLRTIEGVDVVGQARNGEELIALVDRHKPDFVLTDITMPKMDGIQATRHIRQHHPALPVLALSVEDAPETVKAAMGAGARGYLLKSATPAQVQEALQSVRRTGWYRTAQLEQLLLRPCPPAPQDVLTPRQIEVLTMVARGMASKEIAYELGISSKTIDVHRSCVMERLGIRDLAGLTRYALRMGLIKL